MNSQSLPKGQQSRNVQLCPQPDMLPFRSAQTFSLSNSHFKKTNKTKKETSHSFKACVEGTADWNTAS